MSKTRRGVENCAIPGCENQLYANVTVPYINKHFFRFPSNQVQSQQWTDNINKMLPEQEAKITNVKNKRVCEDHFEEKHFTSTFKNRLLKYSVPTIYKPMAIVERCSEDSTLPLNVEEPSTSYVSQESTPPPTSTVTLSDDPPRIRLSKRFASTQPLKTATEEHRKQVMAKGLPKIRPIEGVKQVVLIVSGKGGVGKSTTAVNVATALKIINPSKSVGLLDVDVFGPTIPLMMNLRGKPLLDNNDMMMPLMNYGVKCMSMGFLITDKSPVVWRGLMVMQAIDNLLRKVTWKNTDYLIVDTPPGTGDTLLSLLQNIPISGAIMVTTPQLASVQVAERGAGMLKKLNVPLIGIVENMSSIRCPKCSENIKLMGDKVDTLAKDLQVPILYRFPLINFISETMDKGVPITISKPEDPISHGYRQIGKQIVEFLEETSRKEKVT